MQITSLAGFIEVVGHLIEEWTPKGAGWYLQPWFRGHGDATWSLEAGWHREWEPEQGLGGEFYNEGNLLEKFKLRAPIFLERAPGNDWEWLFLMQHYGLPTRLLDWTESSLVALYFALRDHTGQHDAAVWAMNPWWLNKQTFDDYVLFPADDPRAQPHSPRRPGERLSATLPIAITAIRGSARIAAQRGVFTIHGTERGALDRLTHGRGSPAPCLRRLPIPKAAVHQLRRELAVAGVTESLVFPELSGLCREIRNEFFGY